LKRPEAVPSINGAEVGIAPGGAKEEIANIKI
jgi:hypothetical protein